MSEFEERQLEQLDRALQNLLRGLREAKRHQEQPPVEFDQSIPPVGDVLKLFRKQSLNFSRQGQAR